MTQAASELTTLSGRGLSAGIAVGTAYRVAPWARGIHRIRIEAEEVEEEMGRLRKAVARSQEQLQEVRDRLEAQVGREHSLIVDSHLMMLEDHRFQQEVENRIRRSLQSSERAVRETMESWTALYESLEDPFFRERGADLKEVSERLIANLIEFKPLQAQDLPDDLVLVADRMSLMLLTDYRLERVKALVLSRGGRTSHVSIVARSCRIPVVAGIAGVADKIRTGDAVAVDGSQGLVHLAPTPAQLEAFAEQMRLDAARSRRAQAVRDPCRTKDGRRIRLFVNTEVGSDVDLGLRMGGEGIGLFRSESIYIERSDGPIDEEAQFAIYRDLAKRLGERKAIIRTLDIGDEHHPYFAQLAGVSEPILGLRGIRLSLRHPEIFLNQVRAILRARRYGNLRIVLPMVSEVDEIRRARALIRQAQNDVASAADGSEIEVGIMLEVPAAIFMAEVLAAESDFVLVGSNDLMQFLLAAGRTDEKVADLYNPFHPAVLAVLQRVADVCKRLDKTAIVCGEIASDPICASLLVGMGYENLSMNPFALAEVRERIESSRWNRLRDRVERILRMQSSQEIESFLQDQE